MSGVLRRARGLIERNRKVQTPDGALFEITEEDRSYLYSRRDERVPLPAGAREYLTPDNGRLLELHRAYAAVNTPATVHSQWEPTNVDGYLDLPYFRGDSMIQWHYRELPRATRMKLFIYLSYLLDDDAERLFDKVTEDGLFGCWSYEYEGRPRVSRDLLESINELRFLHRHLGLLDRPGLRVLDIGAGYGRLAHRMATAAPNLVDYCCVDAIPESTFLCEYYLRCRGVTPLARVVPLHELDPLRPGQFDLAVNIHSFSECTYAAVEWWVDMLRELRVPQLFVIPNEPEGLLSREVSGRRDLMPLIEAAGYRLQVREPVIGDTAARAMLRLDDHFHLFELIGAESSPSPS